MLRSIILALGFAFSLVAFGADVECTGQSHSLKIAHEEDVSDTDGIYKFELSDAAGMSSEFKARSVDYFTFLDALWKEGGVEFEATQSEHKFLLKGSPFIERRAALGIPNEVQEPMTCVVKVSLPLVNCLTETPADGETQYVFQFRHGTDMGTTTGYYISRVFSVGANPEEFSTRIVGAFSLNRHLLTEAFEKGSDELLFQWSSGERMELTQWSGAQNFQGLTDVGGSLVPVMCSFRE